MEQQIGIRISDVALARLDRAVEKARLGQPGANITRSDLVRQFLFEGLRRAEVDADAVGAQTESQESARAA